MNNAILQDLVSSYTYDLLPETWEINNISSFSENKKLFPYQIDALRYAVNALYLYYEELENFSTGEEISINNLRKEKLYNKYLYSGDIKKDDLDIRLLKRNDYLFEIYEDYFEQEKDRISFSNFINRMSFWMATGSGKSLIIIKLISILDYLMNNGEIPKNDILFLAPSDDLIDQLQVLVDEYNKYSKNNKKVDLVNLKEFDKQKSDKHEGIQQRLSLGDIRVFYYRSDNISDLGTENDKEAVLNFRNYENNGKWFILLDEAHKGGKESSKKQAYFSIMARNGFLFNFSASFTDQSDIVTTVYDLRLKKFIMNGYGKNIYISKYNYQSFKEDSDDFADEEKQKIVLKSLITLCMLKKHSFKIRSVDKDFYHSPLMITLVDSVNKANSDLELFFRQLERIANKEYDETIFLQARNELIQEFSNNDSYEVGDGNLHIQKSILSTITLEDILKYVFNADSGHGGKVEVIVSSDDKELAFRLKSSSKTSSPFALIKIGDVGTWIKEKLKGYNFISTFVNKNYFRNLNNSNDINILMGSRAFYEGWDSKRPNVLNYINIGTSSDATKYITQSLGRGVRIEPIPNVRVRLNEILKKPDIYLPNQMKRKLKEIKEYISPLETLFVFGTNKKAIEQIINFDFEEDSETINLELTKTTDEKKLLVPKFKNGDYVFEKIPKFKIGLKSLGLLYEYVNSMPYSVLLMMYNGNLMELKLIHKLVNTAYRNIFVKKVEDKLFEINQDYYYQYKDMTRLYWKLIKHVRYKEKVLNEFIEVDGLIKHFEHIKVNKSDFDKISKKISKIYPRKNNIKIDAVQLLQDIRYKNLSDEEAIKALTSLQNSKNQPIEEEYKDLIIKYMPEHYYNPIIYSEKEKINYIRGIINVQSEVEFLKELEEYIEINEEKLREKYDWWKFSKINEHQDNIYIPYFDKNNLLNFKPDFIFWLIKDSNYKIIFVDPKSSADRKWISKVEGFRKIFEGKTFKVNGYEISLDLKLFGKSDYDAGLYKNYWTDNVDSIFEIFR